MSHQRPKKGSVDDLYKESMAPSGGGHEDEIVRLREKLRVAKEKLEAVRAESDQLRTENEQLKEKLQKIHLLSELAAAPAAPAAPDRPKITIAEAWDDDRSSSKQKKEKKKAAAAAAASNKASAGLFRRKSAASVASDRGQHTSPGDSESTSPVVPSVIASIPLRREPLALHNACYEQNVELVAQLIAEGCDINYRDKNNWTPLHCCSSVGHLATCELLLNQRTITVTGIFAVNNDGNTALHYLVRMHPKEKDTEQYMRVMKLITDKGADVNLRNKNGETPLHAACFKSNKLAVTFLLEKGSNPNTKNSQGETSLHYAVRAPSKDLALELLRFGADPKLAGNQLQGTPLDIASKTNQTELVALFKDPKYALIPISLHSIALEKYVPQFVGSGMDTQQFKNLTDEDLQKMNIPEEARKKIIAKTKQLRETPDVNLEELEWEISWDDVAIQKEIGRGNYGIIFKGTWKGREIAVKQLKNPNPELVQDFLGEIDVMKHVRLHENVVNLLGVCKTPRICPLIPLHEFLPMGSLDKLLPQMDLDEETLVRLARGAAAGMVFLHDQNIIHRDLACRNLLATRNAKGETTIKLTDFGMSRFSQVGVIGLEKNPNAAGPLKWMAPEALSYQYVKKTDVWSYGITLIEIATKGGDPYPNETPLQVALAVRDENKVPSLPAGTTAEMGALMHSCWKYLPDDRPSFEDIVTKLDQYHFKLKRAKTSQSQDHGHTIGFSTFGEGFEVGLAGATKSHLSSSGSKKKNY